ncbi:hypothetical protein [uncultured Paraglaciecola sp.]|uniref:hypothetical protein n=1 Tax=uncultured Paraglaciecola sp. TaxID=1765024 RepID=UPI002623D93E|nr:hypothetical protein [uncultured Paraglaciecola sp.]
MNKLESANEKNRSLFVNIAVIVVFVSLMLGFILYLNEGSTNIKRVALENLAEQFSTSVSNAHWQWQGEGRPPIVMLVTYGSKLGENNTLVEKDRKPIFMSRLGWPKAEPSSNGCAKIWDMVLNIPMDIEGFKVFAEYYDGLKTNNNALESVCRYRLSTGPYFEYKVFLGQVLKVKQ